MSNNKLVFGLVIATLVIIFGGAILATKISGGADLKATQEVSLETGETEYDWGEINIDAGVVTKDFVIKNTSNGVLSLANVKTSCMCTTAQVEVESKKSPHFGMHSNSSWVGEVAAGSKAKLTVTFDPAFHGPNGVGPISRQVSLETNDPNQPELTFNLSANVVK